MYVRAPSRTLALAAVLFFTCLQLTACDMRLLPAGSTAAQSGVYELAAAVSAAPSASPGPRSSTIPPRSSQTPSPSPSPLPSPLPSTPAPAAQPLEEIVVTCIGDCTLGGDPRIGQLDAFRSVLQANAGNLGYFFINARPYTQGLTVVNLEGPLTARDTGAEKEFAFKGDPAFAGILSRGGVDVVSLANNHAMDYGDKGYADTLAALEAEGIAAADIGRPVVYETGEWKIGIAASKFPTKERLNTLKADIAYLKEAGCGAIVASIHWNEERTEAPTARIRAEAHAIIDAGADLVVGHHPHILQGIEVYRGRVIAYSLGNFVFGGNRNPYERDTAILQQRFAIVEGRLVPSDFRVLPFAVSGAPGNDYRPVEQGGAAAQKVYDTINRRGALMPEWVAVSEGWQPLGDGEGTVADLQD